MGDFYYYSNKREIYLNIIRDNNIIKSKIHSCIGLQSENF